MKLNFENKNVVIFGGSYGIGFSISKGFVSESANIHIISRNINKENLNILKTDFPNSKIFFYSCDATKQEDLKNLSNILLKNCNNTIDVLILNIGNGKGNINNVLENDNEWNRLWDVNFNSVLYPIREFVNYISINGAITIISSIAGCENINAPNTYSVAKSALITLSKNLSKKLAPKIRVNTIAPGNIFVKGGTWDIKMSQEPFTTKQMLIDKVPLKRFGLPEEISDLVVFVSSDRASFMTGSCVVIDGGQTISY
jgi:3-oxoacyl-[acyl-carrier protein] reductase